jgi:hypothetical protein
LCYYVRREQRGDGGSGEEVDRTFAGGAHVDQGNPDNLPAMMEAAQEYGKY